jgi:ABC-type dipeptide/oligopeptide/nickel transport system permease subunit
MTGSGSERGGAIRRFPPSLLVGLGLLGLVLAFALAAPLFGNPTNQDLTHGLSPSGLPLGLGSPGYLLGSDPLGRSELPRLAYGARVSLTVAVVSNITSLLVGATVGIVAGFYGGIVEQALMRFTDMGLSLPTTLTALVIAAVLPGGMLRVLIIITALFWAYPARLIYGEILRLRHRAFVEAAEAAGASGPTIMRKHLLPHLSPLMITYFPLNAVSAVLFEAGISFLGAGVNPPTPSWGNMISDGESAISYAPHLLVEPALCILVTTMAFVLIGEGLKVMNPDLARVSWLGA